MYKKTTKKSTLFGISICLFLVSGLPNVMADAMYENFQINVGDSLVYHITQEEKVDSVVSTNLGWTLNLTLTNSSSVYGIIDEMWEYWMLNFTDHRINDTLITDNSSNVFWSFPFITLDAITMNRPCTKIIEDDMRFPILLNSTNWANFETDAATFVQDYISESDENFSYTGTSDKKSIHVKEDGGHTHDPTTTTLTMRRIITYDVEYSEEGICDELIVVSETDVRSGEHQTITAYTTTFLRVGASSSSIPGYPVLWIGLIMIVGSIKLSKKHRK